MRSQMYDTPYQIFDIDYLTTSLEGSTIISPHYTGEETDFYQE